MLLSRRTSPLERPTSTARNGGRKWYQCYPYNPQVVEKLLELYTVFYNYVKIGDKAKTHTMKLRIAKGQIKLEDLFYFRGSPSDLFS